MTEIKVGALCWNQYTEWPSLLEAGVRAERLGYDTLWTWDHLYPIVGSSHGPNYEGWLTITAWAQATSRIRVGLMVGANTFRPPTLTAKLATTLDHISNGRAILGIGGAWFEEEHQDFGLDFGSGFPERLRWLGEALPIMRGMLDGTEPTATGDHYDSQHTRNLPLPVQAHLPICIGGGGEKVTLRLVAKYADMNNLGGGFETVRRKDEILVRTARRSGATRPRSSGRRGWGRCSSATTGPRRSACSGRPSIGTGCESPGGPARRTPEDVAEKLAPYLGSAIGTSSRASRADYDEESMTRFATEVKPLLERG